MPKQIAEWNTELKLWTSSKGNQLLEHWEPFLATWPKSGMTQNGQAFELPTLEQRITDLGYSSQPIPEESKLRTPSAIEGDGGAIREDVARAKNRMVQVRDQIGQLAYENGLKVSPSLLPTPNTMEHREIKTPEQIQAMKEKSPGGYRNLRESVINELFRTPQATDGEKGSLQTATEKSKGGGQIGLYHQINELPETNWGRFEPAIKRWEQILGRPAPAPTKPDGRDGAHRLSSMFTEWLMGLPEGWITGLGLKRNDELKLAGNGVVPQQAEMALRILLEDDNLLERIKK